jgi:hypothetical protein
LMRPASSSLSSTAALARRPAESSRASFKAILLQVTVAVRFGRSFQHR